MRARAPVMACCICLRRRYTCPVDVCPMLAPAHTAPSETASGDCIGGTSATSSTQNPGIPPSAPRALGQASDTDSTVGELKADLASGGSAPAYSALAKFVDVRGFGTMPLDMLAYHLSKRQAVEIRREWESEYRYVVLYVGRAMVNRRQLLSQSHLEEAATNARKGFDIKQAQGCNVP
ncbi:KRUF family protein [Besnoitia besnoiti]|uniref:KRUF family protein n=1 Tax=Besnoitia besnoiti TaxID=94643 RepID=A0A2A9M7Q4_BESBE|nr:KRUF family protein [Besnoitia besnoiti]PFH31703.1 KRUF family protein [Besnoitia besnoiti]